MKGAVVSWMLRRLKVQIKISLLQSMEAHGVARRRGSHITYTSEVHMFKDGTWSSYKAQIEAERTSFQIFGQDRRKLYKSGNLPEIDYLLHF
jgi:hypothetical protein